jgi:regulator of sigma D
MKHENFDSYLMKGRFDCTDRVLRSGRGAEKACSPVTRVHPEVVATSHEMSKQSY